MTALLLEAAGIALAALAVAVPLLVGNARELAWHAARDAAEGEPSRELADLDAAGA